MCLDAWTDPDQVLAKLRALIRRNPFLRENSGPEPKDAAQRKTVAMFDAMCESLLASVQAAMKGVICGTLGRQGEDALQSAGLKFLQKLREPQDWDAPLSAVACRCAKDAVAEHCGQNGVPRRQDEGGKAYSDVVWHSVCVRSAAGEPAESPERSCEHVDHYELAKKVGVPAREAFMWAFGEVDPLLSREELARIFDSTVNAVNQAIDRTRRRVKAHLSRVLDLPPEEKRILDNEMRARGRLGPVELAEELGWSVCAVERAIRELRARVAAWLDCGEAGG